MPTLRLVWFFKSFSEAQDTEARIRMALADSALDFLKGDVELPAEMDLNTSVATHRLRETVCGDEFAEDVVATSL